MGFKGFKGSGFRVQGSKKPVNLWNLQNPLNL